MRTMILWLWLLAAPGQDTLSVMFWNVENFYDWRNDSTTVSDAEFSVSGERHWSWKKFQAKANAFAKALFWVEGETGSLPDIVGLAEVENAFVLRQVLSKTALRKTDYRYVHYDSPGLGTPVYAPGPVRRPSFGSRPHAHPAHLLPPNPRHGTFRRKAPPHLPGPPLPRWRLRPSPHPAGGGVSAIMIGGVLRPSRVDSL